MITKEKIERINELANKKKIVGLTEDETDEQLTLRVEYLQAVRKNFREQLDSITIVDDLQCNNKKGGSKMEKDSNKGVYGSAEDLGTKDKLEAGGEAAIYSDAEELAKTNAEDVHKFMADSDEDEQKKPQAKEKQSTKQELEGGVYGEAEVLGEKDKADGDCGEGIYSEGEELAKKNVEQEHDFMAD